MVEPPEQNPEDEKVGAVVKFSWRDWLPKIPRPVLAIGDKELYLVLIEGSGFRIPLPGEEPVVGFFANAVVAAATIRKAEELALRAIQRQWAWKGLKRYADSPTLKVSEITRLSERYRSRSRFGLAFFQA